LLAVVIVCWAIVVSFGYALFIAVRHLIGG